MGFEPTPSTRSEYIAHQRCNRYFSRFRTCRQGSISFRSSFYHLPGAAVYEVFAAVQIARREQRARSGRFGGPPTLFSARRGFGGRSLGSQGAERALAGVRPAWATEPCPPKRVQTHRAARGAARRARSSHLDGRGVRREPLSAARDQPSKRNRPPGDDQPPLLVRRGLLPAAGCGLRLTWFVGMVRGRQAPASDPERLGCYLLAKTPFR